VVVEGIQLVRPDQVVEMTEAPLEKYIREAEAPDTLDRRFLSPITRLPGLQPEPKANGQSGGAAPKAAPGQPSTSGPEKAAPGSPPAPKPETKGS
jgi:hypothetical protein